MNILEQFVKSLYSPSTISKFRNQPILKTIFYVFFFMIIATIPPSVMFGTSITNFFDQSEKHLVEFLPDFTIENGVLYSETAEPIIIEGKNQKIIFDSTGEIKPLDIETSGNTFALLEREVLIITSNEFQQSIAYQDLELNLTKREAVDFIETVGGILPLLLGLLIIFMYLFATGSKFIGIFTLSFIGYLMMKKSNAQLRYRHYWVLAAYAVTLPTIILALFDTFRIDIPFSMTVYWVIAIVMLYLVFRELPLPKNNDNEE